jgi:hypothetical protein
MATRRRRAGYELSHICSGASRSRTMSPLGATRELPKLALDRKSSAKVQAGASDPKRKINALSPYLVSAGREQYGTYSGMSPLRFVAQSNSHRGGKSVSSATK